VFKADSLRVAAAPRRPDSGMLQRNNEDRLGIESGAIAESVMRLILLNKPFQVLPQFTSPDQRRCLREFVPLRGFYPPAASTTTARG